MAMFFVFKENYQTLYNVAVMVIILRCDTKHVDIPKQNNDRVASVGVPNLS